MNIGSSSTPLPVAGINGYNANVEPTNFLQFLRTLISNNLEDHCPIIDENKKQDWVTIAEGLIDHFLVPFPQPDFTTWPDTHERVAILDVTFECIGRMLKRVEGIFVNGQNFIRKLFVRTLDLYCALEPWIDAEIPHGDTLLTPEATREKVFAFLLLFIEVLDGHCLSLKANEFAGRHYLRDILLECTSVCEDIISSVTPATSSISASFFETPRVKESGSEDIPVPANSPFVIILPTNRIPAFLYSLLDVMARALKIPLATDSAVQDVVRRTLTLTRHIYGFYLNPTLTVPLPVRANALIKLLSSITPLRERQAAKELTNRLIEKTIQIRLEGFPPLEWGSVDDDFLQIVQSVGEMMPSETLVYAISHKVSNPSWGATSISLKNIVWAYCRAILSSADEETLALLKSCVECATADQTKTLFQQELSKYPITDSIPPVAFNETGRLHVSPHVWRQRVQCLVEEIISPHSLEWMDDDEGFSVQEMCSRALYELQTYFARPEIGEISSDVRIVLMPKIEELVCLLAHCDHTSCEKFKQHDTPSQIRSYLPVASRLLEGSGENSTPVVRQKVLKLLSTILKHHRTGDEAIPFEGMILRVLADPDRNVRIYAGQALNALIQSYTLLDREGVIRTEAVFTQLYQMFEASRNIIRETLLVTVGSLGKTTNPDVLGHVVCLLIAQLGRQNLVIKAGAYMQILAVAKFQGKSPYSLTQPYMHKLAPYIMTHLPTQPQLLLETCKLLSVNPPDFFSRTLPSTLPILFASCEDKVLDIIARELNDSVPKLFLNRYPHRVLSHIFLLPNQVVMKKALAFIIRTLSEAANATVTLPNICKMCLVPLIAELIVAAGEEDEEQSKQGLVALRRMKAVMSKGDPVPTVDDLSDFLKMHMLGIISDVNDMLRDVQGRKSIKEKRKIIRSLGIMVEQVGPPIHAVAPQIMATFQTMVSIPELSEATMESWYQFLKTLGPNELGSNIGSTSAAMVACWSSFNEKARDIAYQCLEYVVEKGDSIQPYAGDIVDFSSIQRLRPLYAQVKKLRGALKPEEDLQRILEQSLNDNPTVATQALGELKMFMSGPDKQYIRKLVSGDTFDPIVGQILTALFSAVCREGDGMEGLRLLAFECIAVLGAVDPDRCEIPSRTTTMVVLRNFTDESESVFFALHIIQDLLVSAFRSTSDMKYQTEIAYSIQELLKFCQFSPALIASGPTTSIPVKVRHRWAALPKHVVETVAPLLDGRFSLTKGPTPNYQHPIYPTQSTYREWIQSWTSHLINKASGEVARKIFGVFRAAIRNKDVVIARHLLPHLVLNVLVSADEREASAVRLEILSVLEDQDSQSSSSTSDKKLLSAQAVFMLLDHLNKWVRVARQEINSKKVGDNKRTRNQANSQLEEQVGRLDSMLTSIHPSLMAKAALKCRAYARSLMNFEQQILAVKERGGSQDRLTEYYEKMHEIYAQLDEPDGMEGMSSLILAPSLEHQIRHHESTGHWTAAQSCWEVRLQQSPDNVDFHLGLLRCLRNLGHYDTLRTHVRGVLTRHPVWETTLADFTVESAWMVGAWDDVKNLVEKVPNNSSSLVMARLLLSMRQGDADAISHALSTARSVLGAPLTAVGSARGFRRSYESVLDLHLTHELEMIYNTTLALPSGSQVEVRRERKMRLTELADSLADRLNASLPTFRAREPILSMRRTAFAICKDSRNRLEPEIGRSWLASAKIARKAKQWQTAYSAVLQAEQNKAPFSFIESCRLLKATGEPLRALTDLDNSIKHHKIFEVLDLTEKDPSEERKKAKICILRARWMNEAERFEPTLIYNIFAEAAQHQRTWESAHYHLGAFHDECFKNLPEADKVSRGLRMNVYTVKSFSKAILYGSKYIYQTVPRILTIWLDIGEDAQTAPGDYFKKMTDSMSKAFKDVPAYKWFTAFPQIVSRVGHSNPEVFRHLSILIMTVMEAYPKQALWLFMSAVKSTKDNRRERGTSILDRMKSNPSNSRAEVTKLINESIDMTNELLHLCNSHVDDGKSILNMSKDYPRLKRLGRCRLVIPLQESLTASLPPTPAAEATHQPFLPDIPTFHEFADEIDVMRSLAKPRKITIRGSNGQIYMFLGKPKDDLRKDARLMDLNAIINKLLKRNSDARRRQLHIRTYGVVTLNEECGFIQWVPNTIPVRPVLLKYYDGHRVKSWTGEMNDTFAKIKTTPERAAELFSERILPLFPPVFHEWFLETFPEPTEWLASRMTYSRTAAVMSMVGFILGLGDRHCENILLDTNTGDIVHVDFNCLFERGKTLDTPERVPFRLTQNIVDGMGVCGVEGAFRTACEVSLQLLRDNKDPLMSVLDAFVHDPLVEWEDEKRKLDREQPRRNTRVPLKKPSTTSTKQLAMSALNPIEKKLKGIYTTGKERQEREFTTSNLVQALIAEATDLSNLAKMYPGWAPWH